MAESLGTAVLSLSVDDAALRAGLGRAQQQATQAGASIRGALAGGGAAITPVPAGIFGAINRDLDNFRTRAAGVKTAWADFTSSFSGNAALIGAIGLGAAAVSLAQIGQRSQQSAIQLNALAGAYGETGLAAASINRIQGVLGISALAATEGYSKLYGALRGTGLSAAQLEVIMVGTQTAARLSGASAANSAAAFLQLKQGLSSGRLAGDELRSVLENMPILAQAIAAQMGVPVGALKELGAEGKITTDIIYKAIADFAGRPAPPLTAADQIKAAFENLQKSLADALGPAATQVTQTLATAFEYLANYVIANKDAINAFIQGLVAVAPEAARIVLSIGNVVAVFQAWEIASKAVTLAQAALLAISGPAGWAKLAVGVLAFGAAYYGLGQAAEFAKNKIQQQQTETNKTNAAKKADFANVLQGTAAPPAAGPSAEDLNKSAEARLKADNTLAAAQKQYELQFQTGLLEGLALERAKQRLAIEEKQAEVKRAAAAYDQALIGAGFNQADPKVIQAKATLDAAGVNLQTAMLSGADAIAKASREAAKNLRDAYKGIVDARKAAFDLLPDARRRELRDQATGQINEQIQRGELSVTRVLEALPGAIANTFGTIQTANVDPQKLFEVAGKAQGIQEATNKVNEAVAAATTDLATQVKALLEKSWQVNLAVAPGGKVEAAGDVLGGVT
jgi:tape measure domain-containing protein